MGIGSRVGGALAAAAATAVLERAVQHVGKQHRDRFERTNFLGEPVTLLEGPVAVTGALAGAAVFGTGRVRAASLVAGAVSGAVGAYDDLLGDTRVKGFRGHLSALRRGEVTSGAIKIAGVGAAGLAAAALLPRQSGGVGRVVDALADGALIAGTANLINLLDRRPGRALKAVSLLGAPEVIGAAVAAAPSDLAGRSMLGDCGANGLGAMAGTALAATLPRPLRWLVLAGVAGLNLASEKVSFTEVIAGNPTLRAIDEWGRPAR